MTSPDSVPVDSGCHSIPGIPIPFRRNGKSGVHSARMEISILADSSAKIAFPRNARNGPESGGFRQESVEDSKDLLPSQRKISSR